MITTRRNILGVTVALLIALAAPFVNPIHSLVGGASLARAANGGGTILFTRQNHWYTIAPDGTHRHTLTGTADCSDFGCAAFSPDGTRIMVAAHTQDATRSTVAIVKTSGTGYHVLPLPNKTMNIEPGIWLPLGNRIAVHGWDNSNKKRDGIYELDASNGTGFRRLTTSPDGHTEVPLAFSPDGSRLLFFHEAPPRMNGTPLFGDLVETTATGAGRVKLNPPGTSVTADFGSPASWSPDGKQITFTAFSAPASGGQSAVFVANANGTHLRRLTSWGQWSTSAHWSPNGTWILFDKVQPVAGGNHSLFLVHPNGTGLKAITSAARVAVCCAVWSPTAASSCPPWAPRAAIS